MGAVKNYLTELHNSSLDPNSAEGKQVQQKASEQANEAKKAKEPAKRSAIQTEDSGVFWVKRPIKK